MAKLSRFGGLAHVKDVETFREWLAVRAAPAGGDALQPGDHFTVGDLNLNRPGIFRTRNVGAKFRCFRIGNVENAPATVPKMRDVKIPAVVYFLHRQLEGRLGV